MSGAELDFGEIQASIDAAIAANESTLQRETARFEREQADDAGTRDAMAEERRSGRAGREWQVLQQRIDLGQTTFLDIVSGVDQSEEARAVREQLGAQLPGMREQFVEALDEPEEEAVVDELERARAELAATVEELQQLLKGL